MIGDISVFPIIFLMGLFRKYGHYEYSCPGVGNSCLTHHCQAQKGQNLANGRLLFVALKAL